MLLINVCYVFKSLFVVSLGLHGKRGGPEKKKTLLYLSCGLQLKNKKLRDCLIVSHVHMQILSFGSFPHEATSHEICRLVPTLCCFQK